MSRPGSASKSASPGPRRKGKPRGKPFEPGNPYRIAPGEVRNPAGRPRLLTESYRKWLETVNPVDPEHRTNAELVAAAMGVSALEGNVSAAAEIRKATEGVVVEVSERKSVTDMTDDELLALLRQDDGDEEEEEEGGGA